MNQNMTCSRAGGLEDLLDRILDRGVVLQADLIISLAGVPLIGICLRAALAGMDTMLRHGVMTDWDAKSRLSANRPKTEALRAERVFYKGRGACWVESGVYRTWQYGHVYVTNRRLFIYQEIFEKALLTIPLEEIQSVFLESADGEFAMVLFIQFQGRIIRKIRAADPRTLLDTLNDTMTRQGLSLRQNEGIARVTPV
jgi:hypothetical protein